MPFSQAVIDEMKAHLAMPFGHRLVGRYAEAREAEAATRVQSLWRAVRAKKKLVKLVGEQKLQQVGVVESVQCYLRMSKTLYECRGVSSS